jgi:hypothetical protein
MFDQRQPQSGMTCQQNTPHDYCGCKHILGEIGYTERCTLMNGLYVDSFRDGHRTAEIYRLH